MAKAKLTDYLNRSAKGSSTWCATLRGYARSRKNRIETAYMDLAEAVHLAYSTPVDGKPGNRAVYFAWGYGNLYEYTLTELGLSEYKTKLLLRIWDTVQVRLQGIDPLLRHRLVQLGFTKNSFLVGVLDLKNVERWVDVAERCTVLTLQEHIRKMREDLKKRAAAGEEIESFPAPNMNEVVELKRKNFAFTPDRYDNVMLALQRAQEITNSTVPGYNLDLICTDFLATNDFGKAHDPDMKFRLLRRLEALLGLRLVAVDPKKRDVVYGLQALELVLEEEAADGHGVEGEPGRDSRGAGVHEEDCGEVVSEVH